MHRLAPAALLALAPGLARAEDLTGFAALVPIAIVGTVFGFAAVIVGIIVYAVHRNQRLRHETIRLALEKGQPLPADLLDGGAAGAAGAAGTSVARDLRRGLLLLAIGLGLGLYLFFAPAPGAHPNTWSVGFIPGLMGLAYLASYLIGRRQPRGTPTARE